MSKQDSMNIEDRRGYQWPASAITGREMRILAELKEKTGLPICELLRQSVEKMGELIINALKNNGGV